MDAGPSEPVVLWHLDEAIHEGDGLRQGDLVRFPQPEARAKYGIIVTADCDLDKRKHSRLVTLVPMVTAEEIICRCLALDLFESKREALAAYCRKKLLMEESADDPAFLWRLKAMIREGSIDDPNVQAAARAIAHEELEISIPMLRSLFQEAGMRWGKIIERFESQIRERGDILPLAKPPLVDDNVSIVWIRAMWQEKVSDIALRTSESTDRKGLRVAQLASPFRYRLTQMLGQVFADIGLPDTSVISMRAELMEPMP